MITREQLRIRTIQAWRRFLYLTLQVHARRIRRTTVIAITGSCGKTTAKDLTYHVLASRFRGRKTLDTYNGFFALAFTLLKSIPGWHRFAVVEVGTDTPGKIDFLTQTVRPDIGIVLTIGRDHHRAFRTREGVAKEKQQLLTYLPAQGLAVLNADDDLVRPMAAITSAPVVYYGTCEDAGIRAENVRGAWPDRLSFDMIVGDERHHVQTRLCGDFWLPSILPAIAVARHLGMTLDQTVAAVESFEGSFMRMTPIPMPDGTTFILDDWKTPFWSMARITDFFRQARATKKILVLGTISDSPNSQSKTYRLVLQDLLPHVDHVLISGSRSEYFKELVGKYPETQVRIIPDLQEAGDLLETWIAPGSLVLIKGTHRQDHLQRLMIHRQQPITCWDRSCRLTLSCQRCPKLRGAITQP